MRSLPAKPPQPTGHDAPVADRADDLYDRWPIATAISRVIAASPAPWSTRVGLFGCWGQGKTSVLNFLETQQREAGHIVIRYNPSGAASEEEIWRGFGARLIEGLAAQGVQVGWAARLQHRARAWRAELARWLRWGGQAAAVVQVPGAALGGEVAAGLVDKHLGLRRKDVERLSAGLGERRVVVFIDDLDRADPALVPRLLLALRELLDYARFAFVLAFDRRLVGHALEPQHHLAGTAPTHCGEDFLDKVIDFPFELPEPTQEQVRALALDQFARLCPFVPAEAVARGVPWLPANPRRLKLLVRMLSSTRDEALRHEPGELDWDVILLFTLIRAESDALARRLLALADGTGPAAGPWAAQAGGPQGGVDDTPGDTPDDLLGGLLDGLPEDAQAEAGRLAALVRAWHQRRATVPAGRLRYQALFALAPHGITAGEFKAFFQPWCLTHDPAAVQRFIEARRLATQQTRAAIEDEFVQSVLGHYAAVLARAAAAEAGDAHLACMNEALDVLDLLLQALAGPRSVCAPGPGALLRCWDRLFQTALPWRHCDTGLQEAELRHQEVEVLVALAQRVDDPLGVYARLRAGQPADLPAASGEHGDREGRQRRRFIMLLRRRLEPAAIHAAWGCLTHPGGMKRLRAGAEPPAAHYLFAAPDSPLFAPLRQAQLVQAIKDRWGTPEAVADAADYLDLLLGALAGEDDPYATAAQRARFLRAHADVAVALWDLCLSVPSPPRLLGALRRRRDLLMEAGIEARRLQEPEWLRRMDRAA